jgi:hypothetical protein
MRSWMLTTACAVSLIMLASSAEAGRTAIDSRPLLGPNGEFLYDEESGNQLVKSLIGTASGYCDFNGADCGGTGLGYKVTIDGTAYDTVFVHGNGLITFGEAIDFNPDTSVYADINNGVDPLITAYGRTLVSAGQSNELDPQLNGDLVFMQSARTSINSVTGSITTQFYICGKPQEVDGCVDENIRSLTLTPTTAGYEGMFDFSTGAGAGYVIGGVFTPTGSTFLLPAAFQGLTLASAVPEPTTWAMMIGGFGMVGGAMRSVRRKQKITVSDAN